MVGNAAVAALVSAAVEAAVSDEVVDVEEEDTVAEDDADNVAKDEVDPDVDPDADEADAAAAAPMLCSARNTILVSRSFSASLARSDARSICARATSSVSETSQQKAKMRER
jgi:hypothetical protein